MNKCNHCDKHYKWPQDLKRHVRIKHTGFGETLTRKSNNKAKRKANPLKWERISTSSSSKRAKSSIATTAGKLSSKVVPSNVKPVKRSTPTSNKSIHTSIEGIPSSPKLSRESSSSDTAAAADMHSNKDTSNMSIPVTNRLESSPTSNSNGLLTGMDTRKHESSSSSSSNNNDDGSLTHMDVSSSNDSSSQQCSSSHVEQTGALPKTPTAKAFQFRHPFTMYVVGPTGCGKAFGENSFRTCCSNDKATPD